MKNKKNILIITPYFYPAWSYGGIPRVMFDLAKQFISKGYNVECATTDVFDNNNRYNKKYEIVDGIKIHYFKNISNKLVVNFKFPIPLGYKKWLYNNIQRFDIVHIADFRNLCSYYAYKYSKKYSIPFIVSPFGSLPYTNDYKDFIKKIFDFFWSKQMLLEAKYVTVQTNNELQKVYEFGISKKNIKLIPLMIESLKFSTFFNKGIIRKKYGLSNNTIILLFVGRLNKYKATNLMLESFYDYHSIYNDSVLIIVGRDDGYEKELKQLSKKLKLEKNIIFTGAIYYPDIIDYYIESNIYFMAPSHFEETSTASLEALACGTPVLVTEQADIPFLEKYNVGKIVKFDKKNILTGLIQLTENKVKPINCINFIKNNFDIKVIKDIFLNLYYKK